MSRHWEAKQAVWVALVDHGVLHVQVEAGDGGEDQGEGQHWGPHCHSGLHWSHWEGSLYSLWVSCSALAAGQSVVTRKAEGRCCDWTRQARGRQGRPEPLFRPLQSKNTVEILTHVKRQLSTSRQYANTVTGIRNIENRESFKQKCCMDLNFFHPPHSLSGAGRLKYF